MKHFLSVISFLSAFLLNAQTVSVQEAQQAAAQFFNTSKAEISLAHIQKEGNDTLAYFFNNSKGFVMISASRNTIPVLAYSTETLYQSQQVIPAAKMWFQHYYSQIKELKNNSLVNMEAQQAWANLLSGSAAKSDEEAVLPFITSKWGQDNNYNFYCPRDLTGTSNGRAVTGCVATAMAQILYYFRFPESGIGSYQYEHANYGTISANFEEAHYDYDAMTDVPSKINPAASLLIHHLGVAVDMVYGPRASGMYNHKAAYAMRTYFKFSPETQYVFRDSTTMNWDSLIISHLHRRIPLYYAGWSVPNINGHAFVCDGYKKVGENYHYHFNFGWDGHYDGYFYTRSLSPGGENFNLAQELIINACPDTAHYHYPLPLQSGSKLLTSASGSFENKINTNFTDFTWTVMPDLHNLTAIDFTIQYNLAENDTLFITSTDPAVPNTILTCTTGVFTKIYHSDAVLIHFLRHNTEEQSVFKANYKSSYPVYCSGITQKITSSNVSVEDGSGDENYNNCTRCRFLVFLRNNTSISIKFTKFDTEPDEDILYIYDYSGNQYTLLETLSGNLTDAIFTFNTNRLQFIFETSATNTFPGWEFIFYDNSEISENTKPESEWHIYPNPTTGQLRITDSKLRLGDIEIFDVMGRKQKAESRREKEEKEAVMDISHLSAGIYFVRIETEKGIVTKKVIKQ